MSQKNVAEVAHEVKEPFMEKVACKVQLTKRRFFVQMQKRYYCCSLLMTPAMKTQAVMQLSLF